MVTRERLRELFDYDPLSGRLVRKFCAAGEKKITTGVSKQGYLIRWVDKVCYTEHRLVLIFHFGEAPDEIDHANGVKTDNRLENLRWCDRTKNNGNARKRTRCGECSSFYKGVYFRSDWGSSGKWVAQLVFKKQHYWLGAFDREIDAAKAYNAAALLHFGEFAYLNHV